jgi:hypothetical protein
VRPQRKIKKRNVMKIELSRIKRIAEDIISDDEWVNDSHSKAEHDGVKMALRQLIAHVESTGQHSGLDVWKGTDKILKDGYWYVKISDIKLGCV